jgi:hypothetical protein
LILIYALLIKSDTTVYTAYAVLIASAIGGLVTYFTGEGAEETVESIAGISEAAIEQHEELAFFGFIGIIFRRRHGSHRTDSSIQEIIAFPERCLAHVFRFDHRVWPPCRNRIYRW